MRHQIAVEEMLDSKLDAWKCVCVCSVRVCASVLAWERDIAHQVIGQCDGRRRAPQDINIHWLERLCIRLLAYQWFVPVGVHRRNGHSYLLHLAAVRHRRALDDCVERHLQVRQLLCRGKEASKDVVRRKVSKFEGEKWIG